MKKSLVIICFMIASQTLIATTKAQLSPDKRTQVELEFKQKEDKSNSEKYFEYLKDISGPLVALLGILLTLPILRKKLIEDHITKKLNEIQAKNTEIQSYNQKLIDKFIPLTYSNDILTKQALENVFIDLQDGFNISQNSSSDVATLMFYLKTTIQGTIKHFDNNKSQLFSARSFYGFIIEILDLVNYYSKQVVQVPKSTKTQKSDIITKNLRKYVSHSTVVQFKYFKLGIIDSPDSAHFTMFSGKVNRTNNALLMRATFQIYWSPKAVSKLLFIHKIYAPSILSMPNIDPLFGTESRDLYLVGFSISNQLSTNPKDPTKVVDLIYSNPDDFLHFIEALTYDKLKSNFNDTWIANSKFDLSKSIKMTNTDIETFTLKFDNEYLEDMYQQNKREIKKKLKITVPNTRA